MTLRLCVSVLPKTNDEALSLIRKAEEAQADLIEVRLDLFEDFSNLASQTKIPLIATNKLKSERGGYEGTEPERQQTLLDAAKAGFAYVDLNLSSPNLKELVEGIKGLGAKTLVSFHSFEGPLSVSAMERILQEEIASGASVCKIVTTARKVEDNLTVLNFLSAKASKTNLVCFCMGENGKISRLLSPLFGAFFTFASLEQGSETASGQMTIQEMKVAYALLGIK